MRCLPFFLFTLAAPAFAVLPDVQDGDLVFHTSRSTQSLAVQRATGSKYSHMGMVFLKHGQPYVLEAVSTVRYTPLAEWAARGKGGKLVAKRLKAGLSPAQAARLRKEAERYLGKSYDLTFEWSDQRIYCSELVWKSYERALGIRLGETQKLRDFRLDDPAVAAKLRERYGKAVPLAETVISPAAMFSADNLRTL
ncbi:YiiX family permuted papain-like enzyme [Chitinilyticum litopenaei]|uniref:YiiX family permuted papain-like enzyme n=1 Tax=Chitinilyticum litopenaei TaxID=1121276 RepID=UPI00041382AA|nr:YiiX family permuted papain-like enzyme [Chitinilyticum litopenaei]